MSKYIDVEKQLVRLHLLGLSCEDVVKQFLLTAPAADVAEVKHGAWIKHIVPTDFDGEVFNVEHIVCSVCGEEMPLHRWVQDWYSDYCPSCGSRMDLDEVEE